MSDQVGGDPEAVRAHPGGAQCRLCLRVIAGDPLSFKTEEQRQEEEAKIKKDDESRAKWKDRMESKRRGGRNGQAGKRRGRSPPSSNDRGRRSRSRSPIRERDDYNDDERVEPHRVGLKDRIVGKKTRRIVVRWQKGVFWPTKLLKELCHAKGATKPKLKKPYCLDGVKGYLTVHDPKVGCPTGCAFVEEEVGDGTERATEHVRGQDLLRPGEPYIAQCGGYIRLFLLTCFVYPCVGVFVYVYVRHLPTHVFPSKRLQCD